MSKYIPPLRRFGVLLMAGLALALITPGTSYAHNAHTFVAKVHSLNPTPIELKKPEPVVEVQVVAVSAQPPKPETPKGGLGYVLPGNNCVACVRALTGRSQNGNAGTWRASHSTPHIGDILILRAGQQGAGSAGHVAVVVGITGNIIQVAHCNYPGKTWFFDTGAYF